MKWSETVACDCPYGNIAKRIFGDADIIFEQSENGWQGYANIFAAMPDGTFVHYEWDFGSCQICDEWEARELDDDAIEAEMRREMAVLKDRETARKYLSNTEVDETHGPAVAGVLRQWRLNMAAAFEAWCAK